MDVRGIRILAGCLAVAAALPASARDAGAIVDQVTGRVPGVSRGRYLKPGTEVRLGPADGLALGYLASCRREVITGGRVTIGDGQSDVAGGRVAAETFPCPAGRTELRKGQNETGAVVVRGNLLPGMIGGGPLESDRRQRLYGRSPVVDVGGPGTLVIRRLVPQGKPIRLTVRRRDLLAGRLFDLHAAGRTLEPGVYRAAFRGRRAEFRIDAGARPGDTPIAGRLLRLPRGRP